MSPLARWSSFAVLPLVAFFESSAWYGTRAILSIHVMDGGSSVSELGTLYAVITLVGLGGTALAGLGALAVGPWAFLALGALVASVGGVALAVLPADAALIGAAILAFGHGLARPALYGAIARALGDDREHLRSALFLLVWGAANVAALFGSASAGAIGTRGESGLVFAIGAGLGIVAFLLAGGLGVAVWRTAPKDPPPAKRAVRGAQLGAVAAITVVVALAWSLVTSTSFEQLFEIANALDDHDAMSTYMSINPIAVTLSCGALFVLLAILHVAKVRVPTLLPAGLGMVLLGMSATMLLLVDRTDPPEGTLWLSAIVMAIGEVLVGPLLLSRLTGELPLRLETLVAAVWIGLGSLPRVLSRLAPDGEPSRAVAWIAALASVAVGVALAVAALPLRKVFEVSADDEPGAAPTQF